MNEAAARPKRPHYEGDPSLAKVMTRPKWIGALLLAMLVAGGFAWLGQWQLGHAITLASEDAIDGEQPRALTAVTDPGDPVTDESAGTVLSATGSFVRGDYDIVEQRRNGDQEGAWLVGHFEVEGSSGGQLAVAIGWAADVADAAQALAEFDTKASGQQFEIEGRYMPGDAPVVPRADQDPARILSMAPAQLVNLWQPFDGRAYAGFLVVHPASGAGPEQLSSSLLNSLGLDVIDSVPPLPVQTVNWLNVFYAAEWVVFAGFALFFWYRLARDDWEKIHELQMLEAATAAEAQSLDPAGAE